MYGIVFEVNRFKSKYHIHFNWIRAQIIIGGGGHLFVSFLFCYKDQPQSTHLDHQYSSFSWAMMDDLAHFQANLVVKIWWVGAYRGMSSSYRNEYGM